MSDEPALATVKPQPPLLALQTRPPAVSQPINHAMSKSVSLSNNDSSQIINSDFSPELFPTKNSMSTSLYTSTLLSSSNGNEHREMNNSSESIVSSVPPVLARTGKAAIGTRVLPVLDPNGDAPPVKLRHFQPEKKGKQTRHFSPIDNAFSCGAILLAAPASPSSVLENGLGSDTVSTSVANVSSASTTNDHNEQYKRTSHRHARPSPKTIGLFCFFHLVGLSVKERARMLTTTAAPSMSSLDKKSATTTATGT